MSLLKPILLTQAAFDSTNASTFTFSVPTGSDQVTQNRLTILNQSTGAQVYQATQTTFAYSHIVPSGTLTNGTYYSAYINTYNATGDISANSNTIQFYCYSTPTFVFSNIPTGNIIANSTFEFQVTYSQSENELLNSYEFNLYDAQNVLITTSNVLYVGSTAAPPTTISYTFTGLVDATSYYVQALGTTLGGTSLQTALTQITVQYAQPTVYTLMTLTQNCDGGYVTLTSNLTNISGTSSPSPPIYISDAEVDLSASGSWVNWSDGQIDVDGNWTLGIWGRNFTANTQILSFTTSAGDSITINYNTDGTNMWWSVRVVPYTFQYGYYIESSRIAVATSTQQVFMWLRRIDNIYQIQIENKG